MLELGIGRLGRSSIEFHVRGRVADEEKLRAKHKVALMNLDTLRAMPIPDDRRAKMVDYVAAKAA